MVNMVMFTTEEELEELTGLNRDELWDAGFNLDDWDCGFACDKVLHDVEGTDPETGEITADWHKEGYWLISRMENYCVGARHVEYKGKHYYMTYHA
jgi:hypothetical protein